MTMVPCLKLCSNPRRPVCNLLPSGCHHLHSVFFVYYFPILLASFVVFHFIPLFAFFHFPIIFLYVFFFFLFFACNKARSSLFDLPVCILMLCGIFALGPYLWDVDVNDILTFGSRMMSFGLRVLCFQGQRIIDTYALDYVCLVQILNLLISHRLTDVICNS
jgi:hypothetical protein